MTETPIIYPDSPEAATYRTDIEGWVSRTGYFYGENEDAARYAGSTHRQCECGKPAEKYRTVCASCLEEIEVRKWNDRPKEWPEGEPMIYADATDKFFINVSNFLDHCEDEDIDPASVRPVVCIPEFPAEIYPEDLYSDSFPEDMCAEDCLSVEVMDAFKELNVVIRANTMPLSWHPGKNALDCSQIDI